MSKPMTNGEAVMALVHEALRDRNTKQGYARAAKALMTLPLTVEERGHVLYALSYADSDGKPYAWIFQKGKK